MSRFAAIKANRPAADPARPRAGNTAASPSCVSAARVGKKVISGHFSPEMSQALRALALENGASLQALLGEAFDDLLRKYGKHPFGER